jgi:hypothetical protein
MGFKQFIDGEKSELLKLNEALESFYLTESLENGQRVKINSVGGDKLSSALVSKYGQYYTYFDKQPKTSPENIELVISFGNTGASFKRDGDKYTIPNKFYQELVSVSKAAGGRAKSLSNVVSNAKIITKNDFETAVDEVEAIMIEKGYEEANIKLIAKTMKEKVDNDDLAVLTSTSNAKKDFVEILKNVGGPYTKKRAEFGWDNFALRVGNVLETVFKEKTKGKKEDGTVSAGGRIDVKVSKEELLQLMFGTKGNTEKFEKTYNTLYGEGGGESKDFAKELKLGRAYFASEKDDSFIQIVYNQLQKASTPEEMFTPTKGKLFTGKVHETAQTIGVYFPKAKEVFSKFAAIGAKVDTEASIAGNKELEKIIAPLYAAIDKAIGEDNKEDLVTLKAQLGDASIGEVAQTFLYAIGVSEFTKNVVKFSNPHILFDSMSEFYKAEAEKMKIDKEGDEYGKTSTVDMIITNVPAGDLLKLMRDEDTTLEGKDGAVLVMKGGKVAASYYQITLKKTTDTSSIGRNMRLVIKKFGDQFVGNASKLHEALNEGLADKLSEIAKKGVSKLKELGSSFISKVKELAKMLRVWAGSFIDSLVNSTTEKIPSTVAELYPSLLTEGEVYDKVTAMGMKKRDVIPFLEEMISEKGADKVYESYKAANGKIEALLNKMGNGTKKNNVLINITVDEVTSAEFKSTPVRFLVRQLFHYATLETFQKLLKDGQSGKKVAEVSSHIVDLFAEATFGSTTLPVWRVYSGEQKGDLYQLLGTKESFTSERKGRMENLKNDVVLITFTGNTKDANLYMRCLVDIVNGDSKQTYAQYELGYINKGDGISANAKFTKEGEFAL